ncbi:hypothetical protein FRC09_000226 [Ceratobasidium sp. 395]|nr:hypothetical protein FRC09_000226 [Ceratobasidium sp. 395]
MADERVAKLRAALDRTILSTTNPPATKTTPSGVVPGQALFDPPPPKEPKSPALDHSDWSCRQTSAGENYTTNRWKNKAKAKKAAVTRERNRSRSRASTTREDSPHATAGSSQPAESQPANAASQPAGESLPPLPLSQLPETQTQSHTVSRTQLCNDLAPFVGFNPHCYDPDNSHNGTRTFNKDLQHFLRSRKCYK